MRYTRHLPVLLALPSLALASFNCEAVQDGIKFDFHALKGPHSVTTPPEENFPFQINTTWTINPCGPIMKEGGEPSKDQCPHGTQVCGVRRVSEGDGEAPKVIAIPIAGDIEGRHTDQKVQRLKNSEAEADSGKEGLRVILNGGLFNKVKQQAVIEFLCDPDRTGLEGDENDKDKGKGGDKEKRAEPKDRSLNFISYDTANDDKLHVLKLEWKTKYACETVSGGDETPIQGSGWGFFTWFIIILFLGVAAYLIFGSWLNYNRYGARGWDLLPHSDTIRDVPYLLKDWARRVIGTLQGRSGGRGGYSAV